MNLSGIPQNRVLARLLLAAHEAGRLGSLLLANPEQTRQASEALHSPEARQSGWMLHAELPRGFFAALAANPMARPEVFIHEAVAPSGIRFLILRLQHGEHHHRACVPVAGETIHRWLRAIVEGERLSLALTTLDEERCAVVRTELEQEAREQLAWSLASTSGSKGLNQELPADCTRTVLAQLLLAQADVVSRGGEVSWASASILFPPEWAPSDTSDGDMGERVTH